MQTGQGAPGAVPLPVTLGAAGGGQSHADVPKEVRERAEATKAYLEAQLHRRRQEMADRQLRRRALQQQLAAATSDADRSAILAAFEQREKEISRDARKRLTAADFENLVVIGRGAFGEVSAQIEVRCGVVLAHAHPPPPLPLRRCVSCDTLRADRSTR
jgi:hypothetical protein